VTSAHALVVVDVQTGFVTGRQAVPGAATLLASVSGLIARARRSGVLVVQLQNDGPPGALDEPGSPGWALHLPPRPGEPVLRKTGDDGFAGTSLAARLEQHRVSRLAIAGLLSEMCVSATARGAMERGYRVVLPHDAHASYDIPPGPGFAGTVPAGTVARVAEWALGDQAELTAHAADVIFARP
jgi:nicotinamidase-related amidase